MTHKAKNEISHEELDVSGDGSSARYVKIGSKDQIQFKYSDGKVQDASFALQDKVIYPINICPHCNSKATFHRRIQENQDIIGNVWRSEQVIDPGGMVTKKFDYCLDCHKEFLIELYIWKKESNQPQPLRPHPGGA